MSETRPPRIYKIAIMILPIGVVIGTVVFMWAYFVKHQDKTNEQSVIVATGIRMADLQDMVMKFTGSIGPRTIHTESGRTGLRRAASMIEGRLGPQNLGLIVRKDGGVAAHDRLWQSLWVDVRGIDKQDEVVFAAVSYAGPGEVTDANTVSTVMMLASSLAKEKPARTIRLVFLPIDRSPAEQNRWLLDNCLQDGEKCAGIIGLHVMDGEPKAGAEDWLVTAPTTADQAWWAFLSKGDSYSSGGTPSVWLTHAVYSLGAWQDRKEERLKATLAAAQEIRGWLMKAAASSL